MRFQDKLKDKQEIAQVIDQIMNSGESAYLWAHSGGRLHISEVDISNHDSEQATVTFKLHNPTLLSTFAKLPHLNLFHEGLQLIFRSSIDGHSRHQIRLKTPPTILKLSQSQGGDKLSSSELSEDDLLLINEVKNFMSLDRKEVKTSDTNYSFSKGQQVKETSSNFVFSNKDVVNEKKLDHVSTQNRMRIGVSSENSSEISVFVLIDIQTGRAIFQTLSKAYFKIGSNILIHSIYDNQLPNPIKAKITKIGKASEYAKYWQIETVFNTNKTKSKVSNFIGLKRILADDVFSHEVLYQIRDFNTSNALFIEKNVNEFTLGDKMLISSLYGEPLKTPIKAAITRLDNNEDSGEGRLAFLEFTKSA